MSSFLAAHSWSNPGKVTRAGQGERPRRAVSRVTSLPSPMRGPSRQQGDLHPGDERTHPSRFRTNRRRPGAGRTAPLLAAALGDVQCICALSLARKIDVFEPQVVVRKQPRVCGRAADMGTPRHAARISLAHRPPARKLWDLRAHPALLRAAFNLASASLESEVFNMRGLYGSISASTLSSVTLLKSTKRAEDPSGIV
jgi:hypothetical protein